MSRTFRGALVSALSLFAFIGTAAAANALTISPTGNYDIGAPPLGVSFSLTSNSQALNCADLTLGANIAADGTGSIPLGRVAASGCTNSLLGSFTLTQESAWSIAMLLGSGRIAVNVTIPTSGLKFTATGCTFWMEGTTSFQQSVARLPAVVGALTGGGAILRISRNSGMICFAFPVGLAAIFAGDFALNRDMTISG